MNIDDKKSIFIEEKDIKNLKKNYDKAYFGKKVISMVCSILGCLALSKVSYDLGQPILSICAIGASLDFLRVDTMEIIRAIIANKEKEKEKKDAWDDFEYDNKLIK